jgi:hypothetical protein
MGRRDPIAVASKTVAEAAADVARAVRFKRPDDERRARIRLHTANAQVLQLKAAEHLALAQQLEDEAKAPVAS